MSDNCDHNFGTFDDFGVKNDQKVSHNMILMSKYKGQHGGKTGSKNSGRGPPPPFRAMPKRKHFFFREGFPKCFLFMKLNDLRVESSNRNVHDSRMLLRPKQS